MKDGHRLEQGVRVKKLVLGQCRGAWEKLEAVGERRMELVSREDWGKGLGSQWPGITVMLK